MKKYIPRPDYENWLDNYKNQNLIKVLSGMRRSGKSTILEMYANKIQLQELNSTIQFYNFEDLETQQIGDYLNINSYITQRLDNNKQNYIFLDEIQNVQNFEKLIDSLYVKNNVDLYITGSNAYFLSGEWATLLTGRYIEKEVLPYSYKEYKEAINQASNIQKNFLDYIYTGGIPEYVNLVSQNLINPEEFCKNLLNSIIEKDIFKRGSIKNKIVFDKVIKFLLDSIGSEISANSIRKFLILEFNKIDNETITKFLNLLVESKLFDKVSRYDIKGKNLLKTLEKYYVTDPIFRKIYLNKQATDQGHLLENAVYFELKRRFKDVSIGKIDNREVDFVVTDLDGYVSYYQVAFTTIDDNTLNRELEPLYAIKDSNPKFLITNDIDNDPVYDGIRKINAEKWFMDEYKTQ